MVIISKYQKSISIFLPDFVSTQKNHQSRMVGATVGKEGVEPSRLAARDPKSRLSANSSTSPAK